MIGEAGSASNLLKSDDFYARVKIEIQKAGSDKYALVSLDFDNFNFINDLFGYDIGDGVLNRTVNRISGLLFEGEFFAKLHADHFGLWMKVEEGETLFNRLVKMINGKVLIAGLLPPHYNLVCSGGIVRISHVAESLQSLLDRANYARKKAKGNNANTFMFYDKGMGEDLHWRKVITLMIETALQEQEFEMYLQPKVIMKTGHIVGAEALVRWDSKEYGMIYPDRFIHILEQNGFIKQLDFYMLNHACLFLKETIEEGLPVLPISVNFSRMHVRTTNFVDKVFEIVHRHGISPSLIEIEITENVLSSDFQMLVNITSELKYLGFKVSLDDFGSAYSSLNYLKDLPLDIIKIDKGFLNHSANTDRGRIIIAKVVELIKSLRLVSVMEGVEDQEQVDFLQKLGCDLGQGYFFARPMPAAKYKEYLKEGTNIADIDDYISNPSIPGSKSYLKVIPQEFLMDNWELHTLGKNIDMGLMKGYLDSEATIQYINDRALEYLGYTRQELRELFNNSIAAFTHPDDVHIVQKNTALLITSGKPHSFETRVIRKDGKVVIIKGRSSCVTDSHGRLVGIYAFQDVTEELERTQALQRSLEDKIVELEALIGLERNSREALRMSEERYKLIVEHSSSVAFDWDFEQDEMHFSDKCFELFGRAEAVQNVSTSQIMRDKVHIEDIEAFEKWMRDTYKKEGASTCECRIKNADDEFKWMQISSNAICDSVGRPVKAVGVFADIDKQKLEIGALLLKSQLDPLTKLLNKEEICRRIREHLKLQPENKSAFFIVDVDNFKGVNDHLGHQFGDTVLRTVALSIRNIFDETDIAGRFGGDEIAVFMCDCTSAELAAQKAQQLVEAVHNAYYGMISKYVITASVGISIYPDHGIIFEDMYHHADIALYESKFNGKNRYTLYDKSMASNLGENRQIGENTLPIDWTERALSTYFESDFIYNVFELLYETKDIKTTTQMILELAGKRFGVDRVYIFEHSDDCKSTKNTYEWCADSVLPEIDSLQDLPLKALQVFFDSYDKDGILSCEDICNLDPIAREVLEPQGVKSLLHCAISDEGNMVGLVGFDVCKNYRKWTMDEIAALAYLSRVLSVFLIRKKVRSVLATTHDSYVDMLENLNGYIYVVDRNSFEILYMNKAMRELGVRAGKVCYEEAFGADCCCENCPAARLSATNPYGTEEIYSVKVDRWVLAAASRLKWVDGREAALIACTDISMYKK